MIDFNDPNFVANHSVRLFSISSIGNEKEAEMRATAALLSMVMSVSEFGKYFIRESGGSVGQVQCFTEVPLDAGQNLKKKSGDRPDGVVRVLRGKKEWKAIVEVKVGSAVVDQEQFDRYTDYAYNNDFDAFVTISNQTVRPDRLPPVRINKRIKKMKFVHFSWERILSNARILAEKEGVKDEDQEYMLKEFVRYIMEPSTKIMLEPDFGQEWSEVLNAAKMNTLKAHRESIDEVVHKWDGFLSWASLRLSAELGVSVEPRLSKQERDRNEVRIKNLRESVIRYLALKGDLKIPKTAGDLSLHLDLSAKTIRYEVTLEAPSEGSQAVRVRYIRDQLRRTRQNPESLTVIMRWKGKSKIVERKAKDILDEWKCLLVDGDGNLVSKEQMPKEFRLIWTNKIKNSRGKSTKPIVLGILQDMIGFYNKVVEHLQIYSPPVPKMPQKTVERVEGLQAYSFIQKSENQSQES